MRILIIQRLKRAFDLTVDLYSSLDEKSYKLKVPNVPSNSFAGQAWCIVGARESYLKAMENGKWSGFSCSVKKGNKEEYIEKLEKSEKEILKFISDNK